MAYDLTPISAPRAAGPLLRAFVAAVEGTLTAPLLAGQLLASAGVPALRKAVATDQYTGRPPASELFGKHGAVDATEGAGGGAGNPLAGLPEAAAPIGEAPATAADFVAAYRTGRATPEQVARRVLEHSRAADRRDPPMRIFIAQDEDDLLRQARESTARYERGEPLGPLDGVPVAVKDELDQAGYPTTVGTSFLGGSKVADDAEVVARLRRAGALLIGKANMVEIGLGVLGHNPSHGPPRNPYDPGRLCGGSSSGPAAAVAAGLCPIAVAADGGGSIRIPAALCGQVGLKATFGRVSERGAAPLCWSVAHVGPIGASVRDATLAYALMAGPDPRDPNSLGHPAPSVAGVFAHSDDAGSPPLAGVRLGVYRPWFEHAEPDVVSTCAALFDTLKSAGAEVVDVEVRELDLVRIAHLVTIVTEMLASQLPHLSRHRKDYSLETRLNLALAGRIGGHDYVHAQRLRVRLSRQLLETLERVDAIVTPTTGATAPKLEPDAARTGESNLPMTDRLMRFAPAANLTGLPAISFPAGYDREGLPVGFQALGRPWGEELLLRLAAVAERHVARRRPRVHFSLLDAAS
jgi:Asp-tRNA(Asn)/Glu-tRNA(Gln) amidotransferase A subunit family amidase